MAFDAFLKLGDVPGESSDAKHKGEIVVREYAFKVENPNSVGSSGAGAGAGKATFTDFNFSTAMSVASPQLFFACASGKHYPQAVLTLRRSGGTKSTEFYRVTFNTVLVSSYDEDAATTDDIPLVKVGLSFAAMKLEYFPQTSSGAPGPPSTGAWDRTKNGPPNG